LNSTIAFSVPGGKPRNPKRGSASPSAGAGDIIGVEGDQCGCMLTVVNIAEQHFEFRVVVKVGELHPQDVAGVPLLAGQAAAAVKNGHLVGCIEVMVAGNDDAAFAAFPPGNDADVANPVRWVVGLVAVVGDNTRTLG
jgi:hypothetical protein